MSYPSLTLDVDLDSRPLSQGIPLRKPQVVCPGGSQIARSQGFDPVLLQDPVGVGARHSQKWCYPGLSIRVWVEEEPPCEEPVPDGDMTALSSTSPPEHALSNLFVESPVVPHFVLVMLQGLVGAGLKVLPDGCSPLPYSFSR